MLLGLGNAIEQKVYLGHLRSMEDFIVEFLGQSSAAESRVEGFLQLMHTFVSNYRGEWLQSLEYTRVQLQELRKGGSLQLTAEINFDLAGILMEMNRFAGLDDLSEAEAALLENIDMRWMVEESELLLAAILARKGQRQEAQNHLASVLQEYGPDLTKLQQSYRLQAEMELALAEERWDEALAACQALIDNFQAGGYRWYWARQLIDRGDALLKRDGPGDREAAEQAYRQSLEMFTEMGAPGYVRVLEERLEREK
jgi:tetratricopeptide (TPR) repeat protein